MYSRVICWGIFAVGVLTIPIYGVGLVLTLAAIGWGLMLLSAEQPDISSVRMVLRSMWYGVLWIFTLIIYQILPIILFVLGILIAGLPILGRLVLSLLFLMPEQEDFEDVYYETLGPVITGLFIAARGIALVMLLWFWLSTSGYLKEGSWKAYWRFPRFSRERQKEITVAALSAIGFVLLLSFAPNYWILSAGLIIGVPLTLWQLSPSALLPHNHPR